MKEGTPPPSTEAPVFSLFPEHIPMKEGTPSPCTRIPVFSRISSWNIPQKKKAPLPPLPKPPFFHTFQTGTHLNERRHPFPLYLSPRFFTPSKLEHTPMNEGTPPPSTEAFVFSLFPEHIPMKEGSPSPCTGIPFVSQVPKTSFLENLIFLGKIENVENFLI